LKISYEELNIYEVEKFHNDILECIQSGTSSFTLDFINVDKIDLSSIQVLLSAKKYCDEKNIKFTLTNINARQIKQTFKILNLNSLLDISQ